MFDGLFQPMHLLIILGLALLFFGPKRLPELGKGLGTSIRDFKDALSGGPKTDERADTRMPPHQIQAAPPQQAYVDTAAAAQPMPVAAPQHQPAPPPSNSTGA